MITSAVENYPSGYYNRCSNDLVIFNNYRWKVEQKEFMIWMMSISITLNSLTLYILLNNNSSIPNSTKNLWCTRRGYLKWNYIYIISIEL